ncbi:uncharacterized protein LOC119567223 isoform X1 [Chelonia mydas]|uniref:uncharacterized protein LOC119567223 isoform X1 n=1 Tax=Chelonia mydas TaxID=8469 RepID=UPI0018A1B9DB|nr:uncharacterized protein LOC119567223 isoform X1 [Chelonia mydas]
MHPGSIAEQKYDQCLKHNFTDCKFEASLRVYTGNSEECERKLQGSPERQQEMKIIKKKLAQTCEISSEEIKKPDCASPQKRKEAKNIQRLDHNCKQRTPPLVISPDPHEYDAKSIDVFCFKSTRETNKLEESNADFIQEDSRNDYGKNTNKGKKEKNIRNVNGPVRVERSSNISSNSSKHKSVLSKTSTRATDLNSLYLSTIFPYAQRTDRSKASKKNVLNEGESSALCRHSDIMKSKIQNPVLAT